MVKYQQLCERYSVHMRTDICMSHNWDRNVRYGSCIRDSEMSAWGNFYDIFINATHKIMPSTFQQYNCIYFPCHRTSMQSTVRVAVNLSCL